MSETNFTSRRSIVAAAAWTVPVVAVAVAAPMAAASGESITIGTVTPVYPEQTYADIKVTVTGSGGANATVTLAIIAGDGSLSTTTIVTDANGIGWIRHAVAGTVDSTVKATLAAIPAVTTTAQLPIIPIVTGTAVPNGLLPTDATLGPGGGTTGYATAMFNATQLNRPTTVKFWLSNSDYGFLQPDGSYQQVVYVQGTSSAAGLQSPLVYPIGTPTARSVVISTKGISFGAANTYSQTLRYFA